MILFKKYNSVLFNRIREFYPLNTKLSSAVVPEIGTKKQPLITCRRPEYDFYFGDKAYDKFDTIKLASSGWNHYKSRGDYFIIHPIPEACKYESPNVPLSSIALNDSLKECLLSKGFRELTAFQANALRHLKTGAHTVIAAETGCGKTLAYLLPILQKLIGRDCKRVNMPAALILVPNRELAYQVASVADVLAKSVDLKVQVVVGGRTKKMMQNPRIDTTDILVGTPGVIGKLKTVGVYRLSEISYTVLDEADTLLDDSFSDRMPGILSNVSQTQLIMACATLPKTYPSIVENFMYNMTFLKSSNLHKPLYNITQRFLRLSSSSKPSQLLEIAKNAKRPLLVFTNRTTTANWVTKFLESCNLVCSCIHGDMHYAQRIEQWNKFINGPVNILVATDVGSRGLDTTQVSQVVNYDFPFYASDYVHRVGRTGRLGSPSTCKVTNFVIGPLEIELVQNIETAVRTNQPIQKIDGNITKVLKDRIKRQLTKHII